MLVTRLSWHDRARRKHHGHRIAYEGRTLGSAMNCQRAPRVAVDGGRQRMIPESGR